MPGLFVYLFVDFVSGDTIVCVAVSMWLWKAGDKENVLNPKHIYGD